MQVDVQRLEGEEYCGRGRDGRKGGCMARAVFRIETVDLTTGNKEVRFACEKHANELLQSFGPPDHVEPL